MITSKDCSYILIYREQNADRRRNLKVALSVINSYFNDIEIIVVEQDESSKIDLSRYCHIKKVFIPNKGLFNRSWAFNVAVKNTDKQVFIFADIDFIIKKEAFLASLDAINKGFITVRPYSQVVEMSKEDSEELAKTLKLSCLKGNYSQVGFNFSSGILFMTREAYNIVGGWDECFEGWGAEDDVFTDKIRRTGIQSVVINIPAFHQFHPVTGKKANPNYESNLTHMNKFFQKNNEQLIQYIQDNLIQIGDSKKYQGE